MSTPHYHTADSPCLEPAPIVPSNIEGGKAGEPLTVENWYRCVERVNYYIHDHDGHFVAHYPRDPEMSCNQ